jgi:hypothetical protein
VHEECSEEIDYPKVRQVRGDENSMSLMNQGGRFRRKLRIAFDTMIFQYCANERVGVQDVTVADGPWKGLREVFRETISGPPPCGEGADADELDYIYALCELGRRGDAELFDLPTTSRERQHPIHGHYHGLERLDFDVPFTRYPIKFCEKMRRVSSRIVASSETTDGCLFDLADYTPMTKHLQGKGQLKDVKAYIEADMADVDVFVSLDARFIKAFRQIEAKLRKAGARTLVMRPSEFCREANLRPIPFPAPNPRQSMGSPPAKR